MKRFFLFNFLFILLLVFSNIAVSDEYEFSKIEKSFKNFITCELTRDDAVNHFNGRPFTITMIDFFDVQDELDLKIITGAVKCVVDDEHLTLYTAVGLKNILNTNHVLYYTIRDKNFSILATELIQYPYKERCPWSQYWIDIN